MGRNARRGGLRGSRTWLHGIVCGAIVAALPGVAVIAATLLLPAVAYRLAYGTDREGPARAMLLVSAAGLFAPLRLLWDQGGTLSAALDVLSDPARPLLAWCGCGVGWLTCLVAETLVRVAAVSRREQTLRLVTKEREALIQEWTIPGRP